MCTSSRENAEVSGYWFSLKMYYTYIINTEKADQYYVGSKQDLAERIRRHNLDHSKSTKGKGFWVLVRSFPFDSRAEAVQLEIKIKKRGIQRFLEDQEMAG